MVNDWRPATGAEVAMLAAAEGGDRAELLAALVTGPLLMPVSPEAAAGHEPAAWPTGEFEGATHVMAFTSPAAIAACLPGRPVSYRLDSVHDLAEAWPDPSWLLAIDPGLPIGLRLTAAELAALPDLRVEGEEALRAAVRSEDSNAVIAALLRAEMVLPVRVDGPPTRDLTDPEFPWWVVQDVEGQDTVAVFTSEERLQQAIGDHDLVVVSSLQLAEHWPDSSWQLALNPGTPLAVSLAGTAVRELGGWLDELRTDLNAAWKVERQRLMDEAEAAEEAARPAMALRPSGVDDEEEADERDPLAPLLLQIVIPPMYLPAYLEQGYDRAAGLIHAWHGPGRDTPQRLYRRLDLLGEGSPFTVEDQSAVVLRWEPDDETPASWADGPPRMESLVVPAGAALHLIHADGSDEFLARFDPETRRWSAPSP
ncbi:MAG: SseB family protein [Actinoplanes sp.]